MELAQLRYFVTIAETLSYTRAAEVLHVSQPALSYQISRLERELGTLMFDRSSRRIALTPDGELFLPLAQAVLFKADDAVRVLKEHLGVEAGEVRMGCNPSVAAYRVPPLLGSFRRHFPRVRVHLVEGDDIELQQGVLEGTIDFAVVTAPGSPQSLEVFPLAVEDMMLIVPPGHRHAGRSAIALGALSDEQFVSAPSSYNASAQFVDACRRAGFEPRIAYQTGSIKAFVRQGLGVSIVPRMALDGPGGQGLVVIEIENGLTRELNLIRGKDRSTTGATRALMAHVCANLGENTGRQAPAFPATASSPADV
jgi:LysR family transcriptional regulator, transcription activator of glutamate synthase operon